MREGVFCVVGVIGVFVLSLLVTGLLDARVEINQLKRNQDSLAEMLGKTIAEVERARCKCK